MTTPSKHIDQKSLEFNFLKEEGLKHIRELANQTWTDHNLHDPGITILEHLCFALQDLNYKTTFPIEDLIASNPAGNQSLFFSFKDVLPSGPVTINDYRKILIDLEGVRNAIVLPLARPEPHIYIDQVKNQLTALAPDDGVELEDILAIEGTHKVLLELEFDLELGDLNDNKIIELFGVSTGITQILVEFPRWDDPQVNWAAQESITDHLKTVIYHENGQEHRHIEKWSELREEVKSLLYGPRTDQKEPLFDRYRNRVLRALEIRDNVRNKLRKLRNICEDFFAFESVKIEEIAINADIEIDSEADISEVLAEIYYETNKFLSPTVRFRNFHDPDLADSPVDELYSGPILDHGLLKDEDLPKRRILLQVSDLINTIVDIEGVRAVKSFSADSLPEGVLLRGGNQWCIKLNPEANYTPRLTPHRSSVTFYRDDFPLKADLSAVIDRYDRKRSQDHKWDERQSDLLPKVPRGRRRVIDQYYSIQNDFTSNYGIGPEGLPSKANRKRQLQAKQLKAYLTFFEQILLNYQTQLSHFSSLFSINPNIDKTYFNETLRGVPDIDDLYDEQTMSSVIKESDLTYEDRRNRFLNHLMARLGLKVSDYAMLTSDPQGDKPAAKKISTKLHLLENYPEISSNRFRSFDTHSPGAMWDTLNVSGLKKRICMLLGIADPSRRNLSPESQDQLNEGFHLVEHSMLRHQRATDSMGNLLERKYLNVYTEPRCQDNLWREDPYSYLISFILPNWIGRFADSQFQQYFEKTAHLESPSHIGIQFYWVGPEKLELFESHYKRWLEINAQPNPDPIEVTEALNKVVDQINNFQLKEDYDAPVVQLPLRPQPVSQAWIIHDYGDQTSQWVYSEGNNIRQLEYTGTCRRVNQGEGTVALYGIKPPNAQTTDKPAQEINQRLEAIDMKFNMDTHEFSEAGMVFLWQDRDNYWIFHYQAITSKVLLSRVENGVLYKVLENRVTDLRGKEVHLNIEQHKGKLLCRQKSPNTLGSEFILNLPGEFDGTWYGLYTRYSRGTEFTYLRALDPDLVDQEMVPSVGIGYWLIGDDFEII